MNFFTRKCGTTIAQDAGADAGGRRESSFGTLPFELVVEILTKLSTRDQLSARLVSSRWFFALLQDFRPNCILSDTNLARSRDVFQASTFSKLGTITVENLSKRQLPLYSRTRNVILPCSQLAIGSGNSDLNVIRLLRYLCNTVKHLELRGCSFENSKARQINKLRHLEYQNITAFSIVLPNQIGTPGASQQLKNHLRCLPPFLRTLRVPFLTKCSFSFSTPENGGAGLAALVQAVNDAFGVFFAKNGVNVRNFEVVTDSSDFLGLIQHFGHLPHVQNLKFIVTDDHARARGPAYTRFVHNARQMFSTFRELQTCVLKFGNEDFEGSSDMLTSLAKNNANTLQVLEIGHYMEKFIWLTPCEQLTRLRLTVQLNYETLTGFLEYLTARCVALKQDPTNYSERLKHLKSLTLRIDPGSLNVEPKGEDVVYGLIQTWITCLGGLVQLKIACSVPAMRSCNYFLDTFDKLDQLESFHLCDTSSRMGIMHLLRLLDAVNANKNPVLTGRLTACNNAAGQGQGQGHGHCVSIRRTSPDAAAAGALTPKPSFVQSFCRIVNQIEPMVVALRTFNTVSTKMREACVKIRRCIV